jgi:hypothetical protein
MPSMNLVEVRSRLSDGVVLSKLTLFPFPTGKEVCRVAAKGAQGECDKGRGREAQKGTRGCGGRGEARIDGQFDAPLFPSRIESVSVCWACIIVEWPLSMAAAIRDSTREIDSGKQTPSQLQSLTRPYSHCTLKSRSSTVNSSSAKRSQSDLNNHRSFT